MRRPLALLSLHVLPSRARPTRPRRRRAGRRLVALGLALVVVALSTGGCVRYEPEPGAVALTFDDGPHPTWTPQVLDVLDRLRVKATFFVTGENAEQYPGLVADIVRRGHSVQNHSYDHPDLLTLGNAAVTSQIRRTNAAIDGAGAPRPHCLRPPYGSYDDRVAGLAAAEDLELTLWDVDPRDWDRPGVDVIVDRALQAGGGDTILLHDGGGNRSQTVEAVPQIVVELQRRGLAFQRLCAPVG